MKKLTAVSVMIKGRGRVVAFIMLPTHLRDDGDIKTTIPQKDYEKLIGMMSAERGDTVTIG